jgi:hypothetical protein
MRKIYFAGPGRRWEEIRVWIERAKQCGHEVTFDWTLMVEQHGQGNLEHTPPQVLRNAAIMDTQGVLDADLLVMFPWDRIYGAMVELGAALATTTEVWIIGDPARYSIFFDHPLCEQITDAELSDRLAAHLK